MPYPYRTVGTRRPLNLIDYPARYGVVEHWPLNEAALVGMSAYSTNTLTDNNTVTSAAGLVSPLARQFTAANSEYLSIADNAALSTGNVDFWVAAWVYPDTVTGTGSVTQKGSTAQYEWQVRRESNTTWKMLLLTPAGSSRGTVVVTTTISAATWAFLFGYYDSVNGTVNLSLNGAAFQTTGSVTAPTDGTGAFTIGADGVAGTTFWDGRIGPVTFGKSPPLGIASLATEIRDRLYNSGAGRVWPWN